MPTVIPKDMTAPVSTSQETKGGPAQAPEPQVDPKQSEEQKRFEQLSFREKKLRHEARKLQQERQDFERLRSQPPPQLDESWKQRATQEPLAFLNELGVTADKITDMLLNRDLTKEQVQTLEKKLAQVEENQNKILKQAEEDKTQSYQQALKQISNEVKLMVQGSDEFEAIKNMNAEQAVVDLIEETFKAENYIMDISDAAKEVEEYLVEEALKYTQLSKVKAKLNPTPQDIPVAKPGQKITTLTHSTPSTSKPLTAKERKERAILAFQGKLQG